MEMHQVRYFLAVCEELNFTRAARRCQVAQPSLTRAIKLLEQELGGALFHRNQAGARLSPLGSVLRPHLAQIERSMAETRREASEFFTAQQPPMEEPMKVQYLTPIALVALALIATGWFTLAKTDPLSARARIAQPAVTLSPLELHRAIDATALPVQEVKEPF